MSMLEALGDRTVQYGLLFGVVGVFLLRKLLTNRKQNLPPGPRGLPLLGHLFSIDTTVEMNQNFMKWRKEYGDIFTVYIGSSPWVVLNTPELVKEAFVTKGQEFHGRMQLFSTDLFTDGGKDIAFSQPTPTWKAQRQMAHSFIRKYASGTKLEENIEHAMESFCAAVKRQNNTVDIPDEMSMMTYNLLATMCFGRHFEYDDPWMKEFMKAWGDVSEQVGPGLYSDFIPFMKFFERGKIKKMELFMNKFYELINKELEEHKLSFDPDHLRDLTDEMLLFLKQQEESPEKDAALLDRSHLVQVISDIFFGGTDTTSVSLAVTIGYLAKYPQIQAKLHQELDTVLGDTGKVSLKMKEQLPYTNAVLHEAMRIKTIVPIGAPHTTTKDTTLGKYDIPKGTVVVAHVHGVHMDPENFEKPYDFKPERWLDENGKFKYQPFKFLPFSMGPRVCVGESLARADMQLFLAMMFHKYKFEAIPEEPFEVKVKEVVFTVEAEPFRLKLIERY